MYLHYLKKEQEDEERPVQAVKLYTDEREKGKLVYMCVPFISLLCFCQTNKNY